MCTIQDFYETAGSSAPGTNVLSGNIYLIPSSASYFGNPTGLIEIFEEVTKLQTGTANQISFYNFMATIWGNYSNHNDPCNYLRGRYIHFDNQLTNQGPYSTAQTLLKKAKRDYFQYMYYNCSCQVPPLNNIPPPLI